MKTQDKVSYLKVDIFSVPCTDVTTQSVADYFCNSPVSAPFMQQVV